LYPNYLNRLERLGWFKRALWAALPFQTWDELRFEFHALRMRLKQIFQANRYRKIKGFYLNIGCGSEGLQGWINLDLFPAPKVNCLWDARRSLPFLDESCEGIFCEHFLEHMEYTLEVPTFLSECYRVLKSGGKIRLLVPDGETYLQAYSRGGWGDLEKIRQLTEDAQDPWFGHKYKTRMELINMVFRQGIQHAFTYDFETLRIALMKAGFKDARKCDPADSTDLKLNLDHPKRISESLIVEAER